MESLPPNPEIYPYATHNAFHGTELASAEQIVKDRAFKVPQQPESEHRFGPGVYFWENSREAAKRWANFFHSPAPIGVIRASVSISKLLDLLGHEHQQFLTRVRLRIAQHRRVPVADVSVAGALALLKQRNHIDGARVLNPHPNATVVDKKANLYGPTDVILCVYNPENIVVGELVFASINPLS